jgi:hypothetical protein
MTQAAYFPGVARLHSGKPIRQVVIVVAGENPSFDYYFAPRFGLHPSPPVRRYDLFASRRELAGISWASTFVIFCRYVNNAWLRVVREHQAQLAGIGLFVDDDIEAMAAAPELSWLYKLMLRRRAILPWRALTPMLDQVWVSTPYLADRWRAMSPRILGPVADVMDLSATPTPSSQIVIGVHASGSHRADKAWLEPVVRGVLAASPHVTFEIVVERGRDWRWSEDPRVQIIPFRSWPKYRADTAGQGRDILLAPFRPTAVNAARAEVKRIDAARCGAALLVSDQVVYQVSAAEAQLGMVVPLDIGSWTNAILSLAADTDRRRMLVKLNREKLLQVRRTTAPLFVQAGPLAPGAWNLA